MHLLNQQITIEHMSTNCCSNNAYGIVQISHSTQPPLCKSEQGQDEYENIQLLSSNPTNHCRAGMSEYTCDTTISNKETSLDKETVHQIMK